MTDELNILKKLTSDDIADVIRRRHTGYDDKLKGLLFFELYTGTGFSIGEPSRVDAFHMEDMPSKGLSRIVYEFKVSRADYLNEIKNPLKRRAAMRISNRFYYVAPEGMIKITEIPIDCGLLEIDRSSRAVREIVPAPFRDGLPSSWHFFAAVARRAMKEAT